jgi:hypothetical protein
MQTIKPTATEEDVEMMMEWMMAKTTSLRSEYCCDYWGFAFSPAKTILRYSRMKWGTVTPGLSAIAAWLPFWSTGFFGDSFSVDPDSRGGSVLRGVIDAAAAVHINEPGVGSNPKHCFGYDYE